MTFAGYEDVIGFDDAKDFANGQHVGIREQLIC